jgi:hypothetical protein
MFKLPRIVIKESDSPQTKGRKQQLINLEGWGNSVYGTDYMWTRNPQFGDRDTVKQLVNKHWTRGAL